MAKGNAKRILSASLYQPFRPKKETTFDEVLLRNRFECKRLTLCVIDQQLKVIVEQKLRNELPKIVQLLEPYKANLKIVVGSTFNWYWLIDGLQAEGFEVVLAHTLGLYLITGAKVKTDRRDAYSLAKLLLVGAVPAAYIYPVETRPVRDLLRR